MAANLLINGIAFNNAFFICAAIAISIASQILFLKLICKLSLPPKRAVPVAAFMLVLATAAGFHAAVNLKQSNIMPQNLIFEVLSVTEQRYSTIAILKYKNDSETILLRSYIAEPLILRVDDVIETIALPKEITNDANDPFSKQLLRQNIKYTLSLNESNCVIKHKASKGLLESIRSGTHKIFENIFSPETSALLSGLYFDERQYIDKRVLLDFRRAGVMHILSASGFHVGIIAAIPFFVSAIFLFSQSITRAVTLILVIGYLMIAGMPVALLRAALMFGFFLLQRLLFNERNPYNILFWAAIVTLLAFPHELYSLAFQLSFGATLGLIIFLKNANNAFSFLPKFFGSSFALTVSATIITTPIILLTLREINYTGIIANLVAVPGIAIFMVLSLFAVFSSLLSQTLGSALGFLTDKIYDLIRWLMEVFSMLPGHFIVHENTAVILIVFPCIMAIITLLSFKTHKKIQAALLLSAMLCSSIVFIMSQNSLSLEIFPLSQDGSECRIITDRGIAQVIGELRTEEDVKQASDILNKKMIRSCSLYIINPDYENIKAFTRIIKQSCVDECVLDKNFRLSGYMRGFFALLEKEKIKLTFKDMGAT